MRLKFTNIATEIQLQITSPLHRYYNSWIENAEEQDDSKTATDDKASKNQQSAMSGEDSLLKLNKIEAPSMRGDREGVEDSWWQEDQESNKSGSDLSFSDSQESFRSPQTTSSKGHSMSFFSSKSESSEGIVFTAGNIDESVLQFGDLLDTEVQLLYFTNSSQTITKGKSIAATLKQPDLLSRTESSISLNFFSHLFYLPGLSVNFLVIPWLKLRRVKTRNPHFFQVSLKRFLFNWCLLGN